MPNAVKKNKVRAQWEGVIPAITTPFRKDGRLAAERGDGLELMLSGGCGERRQQGQGKKEEGGAAHRDLVVG